MYAPEALPVLGSTFIQREPKPLFKSVVYSGP